jgi:hypothetical protein
MDDNLETLFNKMAQKLLYVPNETIRDDPIYSLMVSIKCLTHRNSGLQSVPSHTAILLITSARLLYSLTLI